MKRKKSVVVQFFLIIGGNVMAINLLKVDLWDVKLELLKSKVLSEEVDLTTFAPFEWDEVYLFRPYTPKELIYKRIGYKWGFIREQSARA